MLVLPWSCGRNVSIPWPIVCLNNAIVVMHTLNSMFMAASQGCEQSQGHEWAACLSHQHQRCKDKGIQLLGFLQWDLRLSSFAISCAVPSLVDSENNLTHPANINSVVSIHVVDVVLPKATNHSAINPKSLLPQQAWKCTKMVLWYHHLLMPPLLCFVCYRDMCWSLRNYWKTPGDQRSL